MKNAVQGFVTVVFVCSLLAGFVAAAEITVEPDVVDALPTTIANAADGDILLLESGVYNATADINVNKSLIIRSVSKHQSPVIAKTMKIYSGSEGSAILQGLHFENTAPLYIYSGRSVSLLQNTFNSIVYIGDFRTAQGDGEQLNIIGNRFLLEGGYIYGTINIEGTYIAGNTFEQNQNLACGTGASIIGNSFENNTAYAVQISTLSPVRIIGNRIKISNYGSGAIAMASTYNNTGAIIANNIVEISAAPEWTFPISYIYGSGHRISNNVFVRRDADGQIAVTNTSYALTGGTPTSYIFGNISIGFGHLTTAASSRLKNNLCTSGTCTITGLTDDIRLTDYLNYRPLADSPAIDAGPVDFEYADTDRSRNDIGAYGGPWPIDMFDVQRDDNCTAPFVYPLYESDANVAAMGQLKVHALGIARLQ